MDDTPTEFGHSRPKVLTKQIVVRLPEDMHQLLVWNSDDNERTPSQTVRLAVQQFLERQVGYVAPY